MREVGLDLLEIEMHLRMKEEEAIAVDTEEVTEEASEGAIEIETPSPEIGRIEWKEVATEEAEMIMIESLYSTLQEEDQEEHSEETEVTSVEETEKKEVSSQEVAIEATLEELMEKMVVSDQEEVTVATEVTLEVATEATLEVVIDKNSMEKEVVIEATEETEVIEGIEGVEGISEVTIEVVIDKTPDKRQEVAREDTTIEVALASC
ncbi:MAG: hypothetical protein ACMG6E_07765 [Candidatus Roizmanbacteria bacterium]